MQAWHSPLET